MTSTIESNSDRFSGTDAYAYQREAPHVLRKEELNQLLVETLNPTAPFLNSNDHALRVCEIGIGNGYLANEYSPFIQHTLISPTHITGIDLVGDHFLNLKQNGIIDEGIVAVGENLPMASDTQDAIILSEVLEHTRTPIIPLKEIQRILRPGGTFVGSVPNSGQAWDIINMLRGDAPHQIRRKIYDPSFTHESHFTADLLEEALAEAGFLDIQIRTNMVRLFPKSDKQIPVASNLIKKFMPRLGDRLIWSASKEDKNIENSMNVPALYVVAGAPRTGKSTISQQLAQATGAQHVSVTDIRYKQTGGKPAFTPQESANAYSQAVNTVSELLKSGESAIWDGTFQSPAAQDNLTDLMTKMPNGYKIIPIVLTARPDKVASRVTSTYDAHVDKDVTPERAYDLAANYKSFPGSIELDTTSVSPQELVDTILKI